MKWIKRLVPVVAVMILGLGIYVALTSGEADVASAPAESAETAPTEPGAPATVNPASPESSDSTEQKVRDDGTNTAPKRVSVGPNASLPAAKSPTQVCAQMNDALEAAFQRTTSGRAFLGEQVAVQEKWVEFVQEFWAQHGAEFRQLAAGVTTQKHETQKVVEALDVYAELYPKLVSGEIAQFDDPQAAMEALQAGETPAENPEFVEATTAVGGALELISACLVSWPVVF